MRFLPAPANENLFGVELTGGSGAEASAGWNDGTAGCAFFLD